MAETWLKKYPDQAHFNFEPIKTWIEEIVEKPGRIIEVGGWRGDLALKALSTFDDVKHWHNYDLILDDDFRKCTDPRYKLITLHDYLWKSTLSHEYTAFIATHMIEHICWHELKKLIKWMPISIKTVLFEAPLPYSAENQSWHGDHSSHVLEKGWKQICQEMEKVGFAVERSKGNTYIFVR